MFIAIHPPVPSQALIGALLAAGHHPVPVESLADAARKEPDGGWRAILVEVGDDLGLALGMAAKLRTDQGAPVLVVADRTRTADLGEVGDFDDFVLTPVDAVELSVRLRRLVGSSGEENHDDVLHHRDLELNTATYQATVAGEPRDLTYMEYELLRFFVENPGRVWSREQILSKVWGYDYFGGSRTVDVHVRRLRAKLGEERSSWITTVRSVGYRFG